MHGIHTVPPCKQHTLHTNTCFNITFNIFKNILVSQKYTQTHSRMGYPPSNYKQHTLWLRTKTHVYAHFKTNTLSLEWRTMSIYVCNAIHQNISYIHTTPAYTSPHKNPLYIQLRRKCSRIFNAFSAPH